MDHVPEEVLETARAPSRLDLWIRFLQRSAPRTVAELGVYRGDFAAAVLRECPSIEKYYMLDPWRHLDDWNKPANKADDVFEGFLAETCQKTEFAAARRVVLRGKTTEVIDRIPDGSLDFAYVDADHTLKGIAIDLIRVWPKIRPGGWLGGDDFSRTVWQHATRFEPTLVFPFAVYFAEAMGAHIFGLPHSQFLMRKEEGGAFAFSDLTASYGEVGLRTQFHPDKVLRLKLAESFPLVGKIARRLRRHSARPNA